MILEYRDKAGEWVQVEDRPRSVRVVSADGSFTLTESNGETTLRTGVACLNVKPQAANSIVIREDR